MDYILYSIKAFPLQLDLIIGASLCSSETINNEFKADFWGESKLERYLTGVEYQMRLALNKILQRVRTQSTTLTQNVYTYTFLVYTYNGCASKLLISLYIQMNIIYLYTYEYVLLIPIYTLHILIRMSKRKRKQRQISK